MLWRGRRQSDNVEDRRGGGFGGGLGRMGGGPRIGRAGMGGGLGMVAIVVIALLFGVDPSILFDDTQMGGGPATYAPSSPPSAADDELKQFVSVVLADTEETWHTLFQKMGRQYQEPTLVLFSGAVQSACGFAQAAVGPFYCPLDRKVYIDLSFYRDLRDRFRAPGDFAQAYVLAHEVGHHVQTLLGISARVQELRGQVNRADGNRLSVMQELQADCLAGVWAHHAGRTRDILEPGDIDEALNAASAIGDDRLQRQTQGTVVPESFTHGSSEQRARWFRRGFDGGALDRCDTFNAGQL